MLGVGEAGFRKFVQACPVGSRDIVGNKRRGVASIMVGSHTF